MAYRYDFERVRGIIRFLQSLELTQDEFDGQPFRVEPWMADALLQIFGRIDDDGQPLVQIAYLELPKKSAKSTLCAALILIALVLMREGADYQIYGAASTQKQAGETVYKIAHHMAKRHPELRELLEIRASTYRIYRRDDPTCVYRAIAADGDTQDGFNPAFVIVDELHRWRTRKAQELWDILTTSGIARKHTLVIAITTAGTETESPIAWAMHEKVRDIERGIYDDPHFYGKIWGALPSDDWQDEELWKRVHPALECNGGHLKIEKLRAKAIEAKHDAAARLKFKRYYLNIWGESEESAIDIAEYDACQNGYIARPCTVPALPTSTAAEYDLRHPPDEILRRFADRFCIVGCDLSLSTDLSAVVAVFPVNERSLDDGVEIIAFPFAPKNGFAKLTKRTGKPYENWCRDGWLHGSDGDVIGTGEMVERLKWCQEMFSVGEFAFDPNCSREVTGALTKLGWQNIVEVKQSYMGMSEGTKKVLSLIQSGKFYHGSNQVLRWNALCVSTVGDKKDNLMFAKPNRMKSAKRIDLMQAAAIAVSRLVVRAPALRPSALTVGFRSV